MKFLPSLFCLFIVIAVSMASCDRQDSQVFLPQLVIEGYIDDQDFPVVMLTTSVAIQSEYSEPFDSLASHLLRWARVAINDGENEYVLTGKFDNSYLPPYIYTTTHFRGQVGKTYTLTVDYKDYHATAVTTIPPRPEVDSIWVKPVIGDSLCSIIVTFSDPSNEVNYYKAFVRRGMTGLQWLPSYLGTVSDDVLNITSNELIVNRAGLVTDTLDYIPYFSYNDTVSVKFSQIDQASYIFWHDFDDHTNFSRNPFLLVTANLHGNIVGGFGCWYGCGSVTKSFILKDYLPHQNHPAR